MNRKILHHSNWAISAGGQRISLYESCVEGDSPFLFVGGVHGDEPEGVELATKLLHWLQKNNKSEFASWLMIPDINPDGSSQGVRTNSNGVDLNRNFPTHDWSPQAKAPRYYPGPKPLSEPETQSLVKLISEKKPRLIVHFHSWEPCVVYTGAPGKPWADILATGTGYPVREDIGYPTPGSLGDYGWHVCQTPVVCIEAQEKTPLSEVWPRFESGLEQLFLSTIRK